MTEARRTEVTLQEESFPQTLAEMLRQAQVKEITVLAGKSIFMDGSTATEAYFVLSGTVNIQKRNERGENRVIAVVGPGELFGEMALLDEPHRVATAQAASDCRLFVISSSQVAKLLTNVPQMGLWMLRVLSKRLRGAVGHIARMEKVQELNTRIIMGQEAERKRVAREIQEGPAQLFSDYIMRVDICEHLLKKSPDKLAGELAALKATLTKGLSRIQNVIAVITPEALQQEGLQTILGRFVGRIQEDYGLKIRFSCASIETDSIDFERQNMVFCLVQSALSNIHAYAQARTVEIEIQKEGDRLTLRIADDGNGFDIDKVRQGFYRSEMENFEAMRDRVMLVGGTMRIQSHPGEGTLLELEVPLTRPDR